MVWSSRRRGCSAQTNPFEKTAAGTEPLSRGYGFFTSGHSLCASGLNASSAGIVAFSV